ncbi:MAG: hypothetical protein ACFFDI_26245 [Promethearchaeota archaeon]
MRLTHLFWMIGVMVTFAVGIVGMVQENTSLILIGYLIGIGTIFVLMLRELIIFCAVLWNNMDKNALFLVGLRTVFFGNLTVLGWSLSLSPFNPGEKLLWVTSFGVIQVLLGFAIAIVEQKFPTSLQIGKVWVSQWPFSKSVIET